MVFTGRQSLAEDGDSDEDADRTTYVIAAAAAE